MIIKHALTLTGCLAMLLFSACSMVGSPTPVNTDPNAQLTALAASRPTLPPTFTPFATRTAIHTNTPSEPDSPTPTLTLTLTLPPSPTRTVTAPPIFTPTWTPDTDALIATPRTATAAASTQQVAAPTNTPFAGCVIAQGAANLLQNAGFEGSTFTQTTDIQVPTGWVAFWRPEGTPVTWDPENTDGYRRPQMRVINGDAPFDSPPRVYAGSHALYLSGGNRVYDAGVYQQITGVSVNDRFCLTAMAHAWATHQSDDRTKSRLITPEDYQNINFQVGIDPSGGTNAYATHVIWGAVGNIYDQYAQIPSVQVSAQSTTITVFIRGWALWRFDHNDMFFDEIKLVKNN